MSDADPIAQQAPLRSQVVAAEVGSARLENAEPDSDVIALAEAFAEGQLDEVAFNDAVERSQQALLADSQQRLTVIGRE